MVLEMLPKIPSLFTQTVSSQALVLKFSTHQNCMEGLLKPRSLGPPPQFLIHESEFAFLTSSQAQLMPLCGNHTHTVQPTRLATEKISQRP